MFVSDSLQLSFIHLNVAERIINLSLPLFDRLKILRFFQRENGLQNVYCADCVFKRQVILGRVFRFSTSMQLSIYYPLFIEALEHLDRRVN